MILNRPEVAQYPIDPTRLDLAREFRRNIYGPHSGELQKILFRFRWAAPGGRWGLVTLSPGRWMLVRLPGRRGVPLETFPDHLYTDLKDAEWEVFCRRWEHVTGQSLKKQLADAE